MGCRVPGTNIYQNFWTSLHLPCYNVKVNTSDTPLFRITEVLFYIIVPSFSSLCMAGVFSLHRNHFTVAGVFKLHRNHFTVAGVCSNCIEIISRTQWSEAIIISPNSWLLHLHYWRKWRWCVRFTYIIDGSGDGAWGAITLLTEVAMVREVPWHLIDWCIDVNVIYLWESKKEFSSNIN